MTERVLGPTGSRRRRRLVTFVPFVLIAALVLAIAASAGPVSNAAVFEGDDGNLDPNAAGLNFDWNSFAPTTWTGTAPDRTATKTTSGWLFVGQEDAQGSNADDGFAGGTKQDDNCASVTGAKAPNKDDVERVYLATKTVGGNVYLALAWVRIPQNTTNASAHIGFEFNQGSIGCTGSDLVNRVAGDMLIVYDFEGSSTDSPTLTLRRWVTSGACEVGSKSPPCWGTATNLSAAGFAEAKVNTSDVGSVSDGIGPAADTLGENEFGEAIIDLTGAGVFGAGQCATFGKAYAVSRSSGNSGTAQMKDLVGPVNFSLANCGSITIIKQTDPRGLNQGFDFTSSIPAPNPPTNQVICAGDQTPAAFTLNDTGNSGKTLGSTAAAQNSAGNTQSCTNLTPGTYTVTEGADPSGFAFGSLTCTDSNGNSTTTLGKQASITVAGGGSTVCLYINNQQRGAIKLTKTRKHAAAGPGDHPHAGVSFSIAGTAVVTDANGQACVGNLAFGSYDVIETVPAGYVADGPTTKSVTVDQNGDCTSGFETVSFSNTPLTNITVSVDSQVDGGTASTINCVVASGSTGANGDGSLTINDLPPGTYNCEIFIDP